MLFGRAKHEMVDPAHALPGRSTPVPVAPRHAVLDAPLAGPFPDGLQTAYFAAGCFWGVERKFWQVPGVVSTAVGYQGGHTPNPTYEETCSGLTGHAEAVQVVFDPAVVTYRDLLRVFWEAHDPTQGMRQGGDRGTQYRSAVYTVGEEQARLARETRDVYQAELSRAGYGAITTEIAPAGPFYFAEDYHQQYLHKVPNGYCGVGGTGVSLGDQSEGGSCAVGTGVDAPRAEAGQQ